MKISSFFRILWYRVRHPGPPSTSEDVTRVFLELFRGHGVRCRLVDGWIVGESGILEAQARVFIGPGGTTFQSCQLDLEVRHRQGRPILESCGGFGASKAEAVGDAVRNLCDGSFHVILSAVTGKSCGHNEVESWEVGGRARTIFLGPMIGRGRPTPAMPAPLDWFPAMEGFIKESDLSPGLHWVRLYHFELPGGAATNEVLLDNEPWEEMIARLAGRGWPAAESFYSVRVFLALIDGPPPIGV